MYPANIKGIGISRALVRRKNGKAAGEVSHRYVQRHEPLTIQAEIDNVNILTQSVVVEE